MKESTNILLRVSIFVIVIMIFFGSMITNLYILQAISCGFAILSTSIKKLKIKKDSILWMIVCLVTVLSVLISQNKSESIKIVILTIIMIIIKIIYENNEGWQNKFIRISMLASGIHVFSTVIQFFFPEVIKNLNRVILSAESFQINQEFCSRGAYAGITGQTGVNSFFIAIFVGCVFTFILYSKGKKRVNYVLLILSIFALFLTGKRGMFAFTILALLIVFLYTIRKDKKKFLKSTILIVLTFIIGVVIINKVPEASVIINKFEQLEESGNVLNGRDVLWEESLKVFKKNPIFGIGEAAIQDVIEGYSHNIYIQLLAETGIVGFSIYIFAFLASLILTLQKAKEILKNNDIEKKRIVMISIFMQCIFLFYGFSGNPLYGHMFLAPYIISIAMVNAIPSNKGSESENESRNSNIS